MQANELGVVANAPRMKSMNGDGTVDLWNDEVDGGLRNSGTEAKESNMMGGLLAVFQFGTCGVVVIALIIGLVIPLLADGIEPEMLEAVRNGDAETVRLLLDAENGTRRANAINKEGGMDLTALHYASLGGTTDVAQVLIDGGAYINTKSGNGLAPLHYATRNGHASGVELLLERDADVNIVDPNGWTPLHWAAVYSRAKIARLLLQYKADPFLANQDEVHKSALSLAMANGHNTLILIIDRAMQAEAERRNATTTNATNNTEEGENSTAWVTTAINSVLR